MENTISLISAVMQTIIAAIGILITVIEIKRDRKEKKRVEKLKKIEEDIIKEIAQSKVDEAKENLEKTLRELEVNMRDFDKHQYYRESIDSLIKEYAVEKKAIERIYKQLLADETEFSLSYGFERYINAFREFINVSDDQLEAVKSKAEEFYDVDQVFVGDNEHRGAKDSILARVERLCEIKNEHPSLTWDDVIEYHKNEMRAQNKMYDVIAKDNMSEMAIYAYFKDYCEKILDPVKIINESIDKIYPFIKELKYKYLRDEQK